MEIYLATQMGGTPFTNAYTVNLLQNYGYTLTQKPSHAAIFVAHDFKHLLRYMLQYPRRKFLIWTNEPRSDINFKNKINLPFGFAKVEVMNVYGKDVFWNNLHFLASYHFDNGNDLGININKPLDHITNEKLNSLKKNNKIAAIFTNTLSPKNQLLKDGININLSQKRCEYALEGNKRKLLDIYGNKWPDGVASGNSGFGFENGTPWWVEKIRILKNYKFNLCFENTSFGYYITEKIWHAIHSYSLPIYTGFNSNIYETFPKDSFIESSMFTDEHALFDYIGAIKGSEYVERMNLCIDAYNNALAIKRENYSQNGNETIKKIIQRLEN